jgi:hypothetical protein
MQKNQRQMATSVIGAEQLRACKGRGFGDGRNVPHIGRRATAKRRAFGRSCRTGSHLDRNEGRHDEKSEFSEVQLMTPVQNGNGGDLGGKRVRKL